MEEEYGYVPVLIEYRVRQIEISLKELLKVERDRENERRDFFWKSILGPIIVGISMLIAQHTWRN